jgi:hypothetical protein
LVSYLSQMNVTMWLATEEGDARSDHLHRPKAAHHTWV